MMKRDLAIDVYRVCLMFGICLLHAITQGGHNVSWAGNILQSTWLGYTCVWIGPSMFSVYLVHSHGQAWGYLKAIEDMLLAHSFPLPMVYMLTAIVVFGVCLLADLPRCIMVSFIRRVR